VSEILESYVDVFGREKTIDPQTRRALEKSLGRARATSRTARAVPGRCYQPQVLERGGRIWGFMTQLYGIRSARNWGIGDFGDLRALIELGARVGASAIGVNPLHAAGVSPYSPTSRHALNWLYLDIEAIAEFSESAAAQRLVRSKAFQARLQALRKAELVDHAGVAAAKREVLELLYDSFRRKAARRRELAAFRKAASKELRRYALFEALREEHDGAWQTWPQSLQDPDAAAVRAFAKKHAGRVEFHEYVQWNARRQLDAAQARALELGMPVGLYVDLALGADRGGAEVWSDQAAYAADMAAGAPPDEFNPRGQDWGLPPYSPRALRAAGYAPFIDLLRANMPEGGALRLDHVMALARLYWIPQGAQPERGGYVQYPFGELLAILASESRRRRCLVVGEDLGTVPKELRAALNEAGVLSYRPLLFEKDAGGEYCPPTAYPREALVCASTHDLPTWRGYFDGKDIELRAAHGLTIDPDKEKQQRHADAQKLLRALEREGLDASAASAHAFLARTPSKVLMVQPEDVFELAEQANLPGSIDQHPNWRRKLPVPLEAWAADPRMAALCKTMEERSFRKEGKTLPPAHAPVATYRLQLHKGFRFADAIALVPYLAQLGVSHLYASPFLLARPGSMHGYDVVDHNRVNPEIGSEAELDELIKALHGRGMGLVLDVVPNHMGVLQGDNAWWLDVLEKGRASRYAKFFDIDWARGGKLLLPVLGKHYGEALEAGEIKLERQGSKWFVSYFDHRFPLNAKSAKGLKPIKDPLQLHRLLERQHYRLSYWRVAADEINYRRFFEITDLAAVRVEDPEVFEETHRLIARLAKRPGVHGLRVDHPDGLADPLRYLERLAALGERPWVVVEKILADYERVPEDWPVHGTTGYRYANVLTGVFIDASAERRFDLIYRRFTGERQSFEEAAYESRLLIMNTTLAAELQGLSMRLARIAAGNRFTRDYTASGLRKALAEIAARFPVYRSYVTARGASDSDRRWIDWAVKAAKRASRIADPSVFDFVRSVLTLEAAPPAGARRQAMIDFAMRFQQFSAPVVAKGVEDTAFYRYHRLIALNEVGGHPAHFGFSLKAFHAASEDRAKHWPYTMLATSTHDTKRSEDVRARLGLLSEMPSAWMLALRRWSKLNRSHRTEADGESLPSRADEYLFYQSLLGVWPHLPPAAAALKGLHERLKTYMLKAAREAKLRTSWINPDTGYEAALERFIAEALRNALFLKDLNETVARLAPLGLLVGLSQALLKAASPGVPDYYQGTELWDFSLVDPDNRRPVDYALRKQLLSRKRHTTDLLTNLADGQAKLHVIRAGLKLRKEHPELFHGGQYLPLYADGGHEEHLVAFALRAGGRTLVAAAPRLFAGLVSEQQPFPIGHAAWGSSRLALPAGRYRDVLTGGSIDASGGSLSVAVLLGEFPVALLTSV
jgi:(1->4)-alpha-D-glucan 1-alpha-D-glucosylmutase